MALIREVKLPCTPRAHVRNEGLQTTGKVLIVKNNIPPPLCVGLTREVEKEHLQSRDRGDDLFEEDLVLFVRVKNVIDHHKVKQGHTRAPFTQNAVGHGRLRVQLKHTQASTTLCVLRDG